MSKEIKSKTTQGEAVDPASALFGVWSPIATAPRDGTPFVWLHYITMLGEVVRYEPELEVIRRAWLGPRAGPGHWMGKHCSRSDIEVAYGWWAPMPPPNRCG